MKIDEMTSHDAHTVGGGETPPCAGFAPSALPDTQSSVAKKSSQKGCPPDVSQPKELSKTTGNRPKAVAHWYALRVTYGREKKAYDYLVAKNIKAFYPTITTVKLVDGKRKSIEVSRLPNIFFAFGTEEQLKAYVYDNVNLPFLRFYYRHIHQGARIVKEPLVVPDVQMESLRIICSAEAEDVILVSSDVPKFKTGQMVRVMDGAFKGVMGRVARYHGQQRVAVIIDGLVTIATAYVPSGFLEKI